MKQIIGKMNEISVSGCETGKRKRAYVYSGFSRPTHYIQGRLIHNLYCVSESSNHTFSVGKNCYNTGKVLIGSLYQKPLNKQISADQEWLQGVLLQPSTPPKELSQTVLWWLYGVAIAVVAFVAN